MRLILSFTLISSLLFSGSSFAQLQSRNGSSNNANSKQNNQEQAPDTTKVNEYKPKVPKEFFIPTGIRIGTDLVALGIDAFGGKRERYEFQADIDIHRVYVAGSFGTSAYRSTGEGFDYSHEGYFYRIGLDANFLKYDPDYNTFTVGIRYATANFSEQLNVNSTDGVFGDYTESFTNDNVRARWFELTTGLRVNIFNNFYTGYTFRIQINRKIFNADEFRSYDIPGFGKAEFNNRWTFNYYLMYRIAWKEKGVMKRTR